MRQSQKPEQSIYIAKEKEISIDLQQLFTFFYKRILYIVYTLFVSLMITGIYVYNLPIEYETTLQFSVVREQDTSSPTNTKLLGSLTNLLAESVAPAPSRAFATLQGAMYSVDYMEKLIRKPLYFSLLDTTLSLEDFYMLDTQVNLDDSISLIGTRMEKFNEYKQKYSAKTLSAISKLREKMSLDLTDLVELSHPITVNELKVRLSDPTAAFQLTEYILHSFLEYINAWHTVNERRNLQFLEQKLTKVKKTYDSVSTALAVYKDTHMHLKSSQARLIKEEFRLEAQLNQQIYLELAIQYEQAKNKLYIKTPSIEVIQPAYMPTGERFEYKKILLIATAIGLFVGIAIIFFQLIGYIFGYSIDFKRFASFFRRNHTS